MAKQISKTVIGGFMVSAIVLLVAAVMIFGSGRFLKTTYNFVLFFDGSIKGLKVGAPVMFRGVEIGSVEKISIRPDPSGKVEAVIPVIISIDPSRIEFDEELDLYEVMPTIVEGRGFKAQLTMASVVTGQLMVELDFLPNKPLRLIGSDIGYPEIPTVPSAIKQMAQTLKELPIQEIFEKLEHAIEGIDNVVNSPEIPKIVNSLNLVLEDTRKLVQNLDAKVASVGTSADVTLKDYGRLARDVNRQVAPLTTSIEATTRDLQKLVRNVDERIEPLTANVEETSKAATEAMVQAKKSLSTFDEDSELNYELTNLLRELSSAAHSLRILADYFERHPDALVQGKEETGGK